MGDKRKERKKRKLGYENTPGGSGTTAKQEGNRGHHQNARLIVIWWFLLQLQKIK